MISNSIDILGLKYDIKQVPVVNKDELRLGQIDFMKQEILIDETLSDYRKEVVLFHEIIHGICNELAIESLNDDEQAVQSLATTLHHIFKTQMIFWE